MKIVPLFPNVQTRTARPSRSSREKARPDSPPAGITVELKSKTGQAANLSRDEAFILLGRTMAQLGRSESAPPPDDLHRIRADKAVNLLIRD